MINVYICEDNREQLDRVNKAVSDTIMIENYDMNIAKVTHDPYELLDDIKKNEGTGLYFLDVDLGTEMNGIHLGEEIRQLDPSGYIIFITTHAELSHLTFKYKVQALDYIIKDDFSEVAKRVRECIVYAHEKYTSSQNDTNEVFYIQSKDKVVIVEYKKIIMFETSPTIHKVILYSENRQVEFYGSMKDVEGKLDDRFVRCHKSFIVNKNKIKEVDKSTRIVHMINGQNCVSSIRGIKLLK